MSEFVLETKELGISFGGLKAVNDVNLKIKQGEIYGLVGRYSKVGEEAFYRFYLPIDETIQAALKK